MYIMIDLIKEKDIFLRIQDIFIELGSSCFLDNILAIRE